MSGSAARNLLIEVAVIGAIGLMRKKARFRSNIVALMQNGCYKSCTL